MERLTYQEHGDPDYVKTFLLTYRSFTTPVELMSLLISRFLCPLPAMISGDNERMELRRTFQKPIRLRVFAVLKMWITQSSDFVDEKDAIVPMLTAFCRDQMEAVMPSGARQLLTLLGKAMRVSVQWRLSLIRRGRESAFARRAVEEAHSHQRQRHSSPRVAYVSPVRAVAADHCSSGGLQHCPPLSFAYSRCVRVLSYSSRVS